MRPDELIKAVQKYDKHADVDALQRACLFAAKMHYDQQRETGEKYLIHPLAVAEILVNYKLDCGSVVAALLHDTVEDTPASYDSVRALFGKSVADLVQGLTKLEGYQLQSSETGQAENFQKLILSSSKDIRILLIKLADRLHNMRTLGICSDEKKRRKAQETMDIYVPLAECLGLHKIRNELENLSFQILNPTAYANITKRLKEAQTKQRANINVIMQNLGQMLKQNKVKGRVLGRVKMPYSLWRKLQTHENEMASIFDVLGFRIIVTTVPDCYRVLGLVHALYKAIPGRFKDYISTPKDSGYRSLQTSVMAPKGLPLEIQIRTEEMEEEAQFGVAAHWSYKQGVKYDGRQLPWMKEFLKLIAQSKSPAEFLKRAKLNMYPDKLFCFDDKGKLYSLPQGATALDFACYQGSKVALKCEGVEINEKEAALATVLQNGDKVKFILAPQIVAERIWNKWVTTAQGRAVLEDYFSDVPKSNTTMSFLTHLWHGRKRNKQILGLTPGTKYEFARCCQPQVGDLIVGIQGKKAVMIHKRTCPMLAKYISKKDGWFSVEWNTSGQFRNALAATLMIIWKTEPESMESVVSVLEKTKVKVLTLSILSQEHKNTKAQAEIYVQDKDHLLDVLDALRALPKVVSVYETKDLL